MPQELIQPGSNLVAFQVRDRGIESFFDVRILAELPPERLAESVFIQVPNVPLSNVEVSCSAVSPREHRTIVKYLVSATGQEGEIDIRQQGDIEGDGTLLADFFLDGVYTHQKIHGRASELIFYGPVLSQNIPIAGSLLESVSSLKARLS